MSSTQLILSLCGLQSQLIRQIDQCLFVHGISNSEYLVLLHLHGTTNKSLRRIDLAEKIGLSASGVTRLLNPMEKNHLVKKESNPRDARVSLVKLTKTGEQILLDASISFDYTAEKILASLSPTKVNRLSALINEIKI